MDAILHVLLAAFEPQDGAGQSAHAAEQADLFLKHVDSAAPAVTVECMEDW